MKAYIIMAYDGTEVIDSSPEAEIRIAAMDNLDERAERELRRARKNIQRLLKSPILRLICACSIKCKEG